MRPNVPSLSCEQCRRRKKKCDKSCPCLQCKNAGIECTAIQRPRLPRGRSGKAQNTNTGLGTRIANLEGLVKQLEGQLAAQVQGPGENSNHAATANGQYPAPTPNQLGQSTTSIGPQIGGEFWVALSQEVAGLRDILEESDDDDSSPTGFHSDQFDPATSSKAILFKHHSAVTNGALQPPSKQRRSILLGLYHERVDCLFKATHWPSVLTAIEEQYIGALYRPSSPSVQALEFAIYFLAVCTISDRESENLLNEERQILLHQYRFSTETLISEAQLLVNPDLTVLQAFLIYLLGVRACMQYSMSWTLLATATRVASQLALPPKESQGWSPQDIEIRRRVWFCIGALDSQTCLDRGLAPLLSPEDLSCPPQVINDSELLRPTLLPNPPHGFTDMSFSHVVHEASISLRKLCAPPLESQTPCSDWNDKVEIVLAFEESMMKHCAPFCADPRPLAQFTQAVAAEIAVDLHLLLRRPPYKRRNPPNLQCDDFDILKETAESVERGLRKSNNTAFAPWAWFAKSWVKWYNLAVLLAELCSFRRDDLTDKAYATAQECFDQYAERIAGTDSAMVWKPIEKLMRRVHHLRGPNSIEHITSILPLSSDLDDGDWNYGKRQSDYHTTPYAGQTASIAAINGNLMPEYISTTAGFATGTATANLYTSQESQWQPTLPARVEPEPGLSWVNWDLFLDDLNGLENVFQQF